MIWPFEPLIPLHYGVVLADPAWYFRNWSKAGEIKNPTAKYDCMTTKEITALPVGHLAADDCMLFLWATWPMLPQCIGVMRAWGFRYVTGGAWHKKTKHGKTAFGTGYVLRSASEPFLIGAIGKPHQKSFSERGLIEAKTRGHSRKPVDAHEMLERMYPDTWKVELFSRCTRPGWDAWGNETGKFDEK